MTTNSSYDKFTMSKYEIAPICPSCGWKISKRKFAQLVRETLANNDQRVSWSCGLDDKKHPDTISNFGCAGRSTTIYVDMWKYGDEYLPNYDGQIDLFVDKNGTDYTVNRNQADYHYKWSNGQYGIGYYRVDNQ